MKLAHQKIGTKGHIYYGATAKKKQNLKKVKLKTWMVTERRSKQNVVSTIRFAK